MIVKEVDEASQIQGSMVSRSEGLHLSDIIKSMCVDMRIPPFDKKSDMGQDQLETFGEIGFIWEEIVAQVWASRAGERPDEVSLDGIACSPDGLLVDDGSYIEPGRLILAEYKSTWKSMRTCVPWNEFRWMTQVKCYCKVVGITDVIFRVFYVCGDYKPPFPKIKSYLIQFTQEEIDASWNMILQHARQKGML